MTPTQLVVDAPGHVGQVEAAVIGCYPGMEHDLEEEVSQLLLEVLAALACLLVIGVERFENFICLFDEVGS